MLTFGLFTHMACGATYALVPFIDRKALGGVAGIVGAGGNVGAVAASFLLKGVGDVQHALSLLGLPSPRPRCARWPCASVKSTRRAKPSCATARWLPAASRTDRPKETSP